MVCGAPTSRSSGGRSAVTTIIGTAESPASTTAGARLAAAVPLVVSTTAGRAAEPEAEPDEAGDAFIVDDRDRQSIGEGQRHRGAARTGRDDGVTNTPIDPLVDERGAERGLGVAAGTGHRPDDTAHPHHRVCSLARGRATVSAANALSWRRGRPGS